MDGRLMVSAGAALVLAAAVPSAAQTRRARRPIRFQEMDRNNDRVIARSEWQGTDESFKLHDWNGDGVLSGDEVRLGATSTARAREDFDFDTPDREYRFDDWTPQGFAALDHNRDGRIAWKEWHFDRESFRRADHNGDNFLSRSEFLLQDSVDDDRGDRFLNLDHDRDGRLSKTEWHGAPRVFDLLDTNHDGFVTRVEMLGPEMPQDLFTGADVNRDGVIDVNEWHWSRAAFDRRDVNRDGRLTREEFSAAGAVGTSGTQHSAAYNAGYERGAQEARVQAREDRVQNHGFDPEGQRELETADSGYEARMGPKADYQAGYRAGWRRGYPEGWRQP